MLSNESQCLRSTVYRPFMLKAPFNVILFQNHFVYQNLSKNKTALNFFLALTILSPTCINHLQVKKLPNKLDAITSFLFPFFISIRLGGIFHNVPCFSNSGQYFHFIPNENIRKQWFADVFKEYKMETLSRVG